MATDEMASGGDFQEQMRTAIGELFDRKLAPLWEAIAELRTEVASLRAMIEAD